jgi:RNA polymerase sigma-70 factor, ECF subfamily
MQQGCFFKSWGRARRISRLGECPVSDHAEPVPTDPKGQTLGGKTLPFSRPANAAKLTYPELRHENDLALMREVQAKNGDALAVLFDRYYNVVLSVGLKILRDRAEAEDILQTIFLEIYQRAGQFDPSRGNFYVWMMQYAYHRSINRKNYLIIRKFYGNIAVDDLSEFEQGMLELYTEPAYECKQFVREALEMLTEGQKRTIEMVHFQGLTLKEIAEQTDETFSNVRHHYYRGLAKLKIHLKSIRNGGRENGTRASDLGITNAEA